MDYFKKYVYMLMFGNIALEDKKRPPFFVLFYEILWFRHFTFTVTIFRSFEEVKMENVWKECTFQTFLPVLLSPNNKGHDMAKDITQTTEIMTVTLLLEL